MTYVLGSIIARLGSKRLPYKNLLPFRGKPLIGYGIELMRKSKRIDRIVVSTESELIALVAQDFGAQVIMRPEELAGDKIPSVPVFRHIVEQIPCTLHVNYNINLPLCDPQAIDRAVELLEEQIAQGKREEVLSDPVAVWAQSVKCLDEYGDPWNIQALRFADTRIAPIDIHTEEELLEAYKRALRSSSTTTSIFLGSTKERTRSATSASGQF